MAEEIELGIDAPIGRADWVIQNVIALAKLGARLDITLNTTGGLVSGTVVDSGEYLRLLVEKTLERHPENELYQAVADRFAGFEDVMQNDDAKGDGPYFIHLMNTSVATPDGMSTPEPNVVWRGKVSSITGFTFGRSGPRR